MMNPLAVVVVLEVEEFSLKILSVPEEDVVKVLGTDRPGQSLNKGMRMRRIRDGLDLVDPKNS